MAMRRVTIWWDCEHCDANGRVWAPRKGGGFLETERCPVCGGLAQTPEFYYVTNKKPADGRITLYSRPEGAESASSAPPAGEDFHLVDPALV